MLMLCYVRSSVAVTIVLVDEETLRRFVVLAREAGMTNGDYVYFTIDMIPGVYRANNFSPGDATNEQFREASMSVYHVRRSVFVLRMCIRGA